jgi:cytochrome P450
MRQTGNFHKYITEYHRQYGPVVRTAPSLVSATSQEAVKSVLSNKKYIKSDFVQKLRDMIGSNILTIQPSDEHLARKKMVLKSIKSMETELNQVIGNFGLDRMSEKWRNKEGPFKVNLIDEFNFLVTVSFHE